MQMKSSRTLATVAGGYNRRRTVPPFVLMTDEDRLADPAGIIAHLPPGSAVIVRDRDPDKAAEQAWALCPSAAAAGVLVLVSAPRPPARPIADGYHIPERALSFWRRRDVHRLQPLLVTVSAHTAGAVRRAAAFGADAVLISAVFPTPSHPEKQALGLQRFAALARLSQVPVIALGGIGREQVRRVRAAGADGIAGIGLFSGDI
jgi:thiamine-phosphate pyrophosphorylase